MILEYFFKALVALNLSFLTKIDLAVTKWLRLYIELPVGTAMIFISEKLKDNYMTRTEHFKAFINGHHTSALADHVTSTGHNLKWDHFEILAKALSVIHCEIKETLLMEDLKPTLNEYVSSEKLCLY